MKNTMLLEMDTRHNGITFVHKQIIINIHIPIVSPINTMMHG